jgi:hypothetical protein
MSFRDNKNVDKTFLFLQRLRLVAKEANRSNIESYHIQISTS